MRLVAHDFRRLRLGHARQRLCCRGQPGHNRQLEHDELQRREAGRNDWYAGLAVQNLGSSQATVNIVYYNADGTQRGAEPARQVPAKATRVYNPAPTNAGITSFQGSAVVTANQPIAVVVNLITAGSTDDTGMSYTGLNH